MHKVNIAHFYIYRESEEGRKVGEGINVMILLFATDFAVLKV